MNHGQSLHAGERFKPLTGGEIDLTLASLDDARGCAPAAHIWVEDKLPWVFIGDGLLQFARAAEGA